MRRVFLNFRKSLSNLSLLILGILSLFLGVSWLASDDAFAATFKAGNIMSDEVMANYGSMTVGQIDSFLRSQCRYGANCLYAKTFNGQTAAKVIWQAARDYRINPQVIIVLLQKEQSLITGTATSTRLRKATGYGCPDTAACNSKYYGFVNQVRNAASLFRTVLNGGWSNYPAYTTRYIQYSPRANCGGTYVYIENRATSALYRYTPYQPNAAAISGGGDSCSAYGNRNFFNYFQKWFGSTGGGAPEVDWAAVNALNSTYYFPNETFALRIGGNKTLEFNGTSSGTSARLGNFHGGTNQLFTLERSGKYYKIRHVYSGKYVDVSNAGVTNGTKIHLWDGNDTCAQKWAIEAAGDKYEIRSACSAFDLDVDSAQIDTDGAKVQLWKDNDTVAQRWTLKSVSSSLVVNGDYQLGSETESIVIGLPEDNAAEGVDFKTTTSTTATSQNFYVERTSEGFYTFYNRLAEQFLDVSNASSVEGTPVQIWHGNGTCAQKWIVERYGSGYHIRTSCSGQSLDISNAEISKENVKVQIWNNNNTIAQLWFFKSVVGNPIQSGELYRIENVETGQQIGWRGDASSLGQALELITDDEEAAEATRDEESDSEEINTEEIYDRFRIYYEGRTGYYKFVAEDSGLVVDLAGGSWGTGIKLQTWDNNDTKAQRWVLTRAGENQFKIVSTVSSLPVRFTRDASTLGTWLETTNHNNEASQFWRFVRATDD